MGHRQLVSIDLCESIQQGNLQVDAEAGVIRNVKFLGFVSRNKHGRDVESTEYKREAAERALPLYEGTQIFIDHPPDRSQPQRERSSRDLAGFLESCRVEHDGCYGDINTTKGTPAGDLLLGLAIRCPHKIGLSHNSRGKVYVDRPARKNIIESIEKVHSVDVVTRPATTKNLLESLEHPIMATTLKQILAARKFKKPDVIIQLLEAEDMGYGADAAPPEPAMPAEGDKLHWREHLKNAIGALRDDETLDEGALKKKIMSLLKELKDEGKTEEEPEEPEEEPEETETPESLEEQVAALKRRDNVRNLCESLDYVAKGDELEALIAAPTEKIRKTLIERFKKAAAPVKRSGVSSTSSRSVNLRESQEDSKPAKTRAEFLKRVTHGRVTVKK